MLEYLNNLDTQLFTFLNGINSPFMDTVMFWISHKYTWVPLYAFFLYLIIKTYKWKSIFIILGVVLLIFMSDKISVFFKDYFERFRPCHEPSLEGLVHIVKNKCGGKFGFVSSHAANSFALATFLSLIFKGKIKYFPIILIAWASIVAYSRVYLGVHYPGDIICGALLGTGIAFFVYFVLKRFDLITN